MPGSSASVLIRQQQQIPEGKKEYVSRSDREGGKKKRYSNLQLGCEPQKINQAIEQSSGRPVHPFEACLGSSYPNAAPTERRTTPSVSARSNADPLMCLYPINLSRRPDLLPLVCYPINLLLCFKGYACSSSRR